MSASVSDSLEAFKVWFRPVCLPRTFHSGLDSVLAAKGFTVRPSGDQRCTLISYDEAHRIAGSIWFSAWITTPEGLEFAAAVSDPEPLNQEQRAMLAFIGRESLLDAPNGLCIAKALLTYLLLQLERHQAEAVQVDPATEYALLCAKAKSNGKRQRVANPGPQRKRKRGRPRKADQLPAVYGSKWLETSFVRLGLTPSEKTVARKLLCLLRTHYIDTLPAPQGRIIKRRSLGKRTVVASTFRKLRDAGLISETQRIKGRSEGRASSGITNLGPAFFDHSQLIAPQDEGRKRDPRKPIFCPTKRLAVTGFHNKNATLALEPSKEGPIGVAPGASAPLRAAAPEPTREDEAKSKLMTQQHSDQPVDKRINGMSNPLNVGVGDVVWHGQKKMIVQPGFDWEKNEYRLLCVESQETMWLPATLLRVED